MEKGGAKKVIAAATHAVLSGPAIDRLRESVIENVVLLDTIALPEEKRLDQVYHPHGGTGVFRGDRADL